MLQDKGNIIVYIGRNFAMVVGIVLVWRGIWELLNIVEFLFFGGSNSIYTAIGGIVLGLAILYFPDKDLKELEKL